MEAKLLTDKTRLQEIYDLRITAYQYSSYSKYINNQIYPKGYSDKLDSLETTYHWIVENNQKIIGSARLAVIDDSGDMQENLTGLDLPAERPFAYCGKTVVHPDFRRTKTILQLDQVVLQFIAENTWINFGLCYVIPERIEAVKGLGFRQIGEIEYDWGNQNRMTLGAFLLQRQNL